MKLFRFLIIAFSFLSIIVFTRCSKDDFNPSYELRFTNISSNSYLIEVDGNNDIIEGNAYKKYSLKKGTYSWKVTQQIGYIMYPTVQSGTVTLDQDKEIVFP